MIITGTEWLPKDHSRLTCGPAGGKYLQAPVNLIKQPADCNPVLHRCIILHRELFKHS